MSAALAVADALGARLAGSPAVTALVPANDIVAGLSRPVAFPSIILGQDQEVDAEETTGPQRRMKVFSTIHVWDRSGGVTIVKRMNNAIRAAVLASPLALDGCRCVRVRYAGSQCMHDPDGKTAHGVVEFETDVELAA